VRISDSDKGGIYWHRELPPFDAELMGELAAQRQHRARRLTDGMVSRRTSARSSLAVLACVIDSILRCPRPVARGICARRPAERVLLPGTSLAEELL
jgi:hypothetical protein